jgi:peptidoglycan hydrolase-like protein with peptidoglycan-binding domain
MADPPKRTSPDPLFDNTPPRDRSLSSQTEIGADVPMEPLISGAELGLFTPAALQRAVARQAMPPLSPGDSGPNLAALQRELCALGLLDAEQDELEPVYGSQTTSAIRQFQEANALPVTGAADGFTRARLSTAARARGTAHR